MLLAVVAIGDLFPLRGRRVQRNDPHVTIMGRYRVPHSTWVWAASVAGETAFRKSDTAFQKAYNAELAKFKQTSEFATILKKWGFDPEAAKGVTAAELCKNPG